MLLPVADARDGVAHRFKLNAAHRHVVARVADGVACPCVIVGRMSKRREETGGGSGCSGGCACKERATGDLGAGHDGFLL